jgi:hypothetical protein
MPDKTLVCKDCRTEFIFSEGEQAFYKEKGFENEPQRCPECRRARKMQRRNDMGSAGRTGGRMQNNRW